MRRPWVGSGIASSTASQQRRAVRSTLSSRTCGPPPRRMIYPPLRRQLPDFGSSSPTRTTALKSVWVTAPRPRSPSPARRPPWPRPRARGFSSVRSRPSGPACGESAVRQAKAAAGDKDVVICTASVLQPCLNAGLMDEIQIDVAPPLLGKGVRLFDHLNIEPITLEWTQAVAAPGLTHPGYRVLK